MAKFYLTDVPTTPKGSSRSRPANIPKEPYQVQGRAPTFPQINAKVADINIEKNIPSLMQKELPREVSSGLVEGVQETGRAQARAGQASAAAAEAWGKAAQSMSESLSNVAVYLQKSKDIADASRIDNAWNSVNDEFDEVVSKGKLNAMEANNLWPEYEAKLNGLVEPMNLSKHVRDSGMPKLTHNMSRKRIDLQDGMRVEQAKSDLTAMETAAKADLQDGDIESAIDRVHKMVEAKHISPAVGDKTIAEYKETYVEWKSSKLIAELPRPSTQELEKLKRGEKSEFFPDLKNPVTIDRLLNEAYKTTNRQESEANEEVNAKIATGEIKSGDDIDKVSRGRLPQHKADQWASTLTADIPLDYESVSTIRNDIAAYPGSKIDKTFQLKNELHSRILTQVPPPAKGEKGGLREQLFDELDKRDKDILENAVKPAQQYWNELKQEAHAQTTAGLIFGDPRPPISIFAYEFGTGGLKAKEGYERKPLPVTKLKTAEDRQKVFEREQAAYADMEKWLTTKPEATRDEIADKWAKIVGPEAMKSATEKLKEKARGIPAETPSVAPPSRRGYNMGTPPPTTSSTGEPISHTVAEVTAYRPGATRAMGLSPTVEGGPDDAHGQRILGKTTMEDYAAGKGNYVTVAMDKKSPWQNKYLASPQYPGVVFRVRDNGGYGNNRTGLNWIDIAWTDAEKAKASKQRNVEFQVVDEKTANQIRSQRGKA
jgi:hypothetical protein